MMNEVEYDRDEEMKARGKTAQENLLAILDGHENVAGLARSAYKYTDCGASLGALIYAGEDNPGRWVYGDALRDLKPEDFICALSVSSIVEGVDQTTETHVIDLFDEKFETPEMAAAAYGRALDAVENEANDIWNDTHGCRTCAKHFRVDDDDLSPVWDKCPDCEGGGTIL